MHSDNVETLQREVYRRRGRRTNKRIRSNQTQNVEESLSAQLVPSSPPESAVKISKVDNCNTKLETNLVCTSLLESEETLLSQQIVPLLSSSSLSQEQKPASVSQKGSQERHVKCNNNDNSSNNKDMFTHTDLSKDLTRPKVEEQEEEEEEKQEQEQQQELEEQTINITNMESGDTYYKINIESAVPTTKQTNTAEILERKAAYDNKPFLCKDSSGASNYSDVEHHESENEEEEEELE